MNNDLISREALFEKWASKATITAPGLAPVMMMTVAKTLPAVDAEPVRPGRWLPTNDDKKKRCNQCYIVHLIEQYPHGQANFCPNCGARMDGENDG